MNDETKEIVLQKNQSPADIASQVLKYGGNLDGLEKLMALQEQHEANEARKAYHKAMSEFKKNVPDILKTKRVEYKNKDGSKTVFDHADLGVIAPAIGEALGEYGLSATWKTDQENNIKVTCTITHALGHSESTSLTAPPDTSGGKNNIQAVASTVTYLERYTLLAITGLAAHGQDDDGRAAEIQLPPEVLAEIQAIKTEGEFNQYWKDNKEKHTETRSLFIAAMRAQKEAIAEGLV